MEDVQRHTPLHAILFDYGLVLSGPPNATAWERIRSILGFEEGLLHNGYWAYRHAYDSGTLSGQSYWKLIASEAGRSALTPTELRSLLDADTDLWTDLNVGMVEWATSLQGAGIATGILSNIGDEMELGVLRKHPWLMDFRHITWSHRLRTAKPNPAIYRHAADGLRVSPFNILFIDDKLENIEAARGCGMQTILYSTADHFIESLQDLGPTSLLEQPPRLP